MKKHLRWILGGAVLFSSHVTSKAVEATMFMPLNAKQIYQSSSVGSSLIFRGKVLKTEDLRDEGSRLITFEIKEVIRGDLKVGETKTLRFSNPQLSSPQKNLLTSYSEPLPSGLTPSQEVVLFVGPNLRGDYIPTGGYAQSFFNVNYTNGKAFLINPLKNSNLVTKTSPLLTQKALTEMKGNNQAISWETFKALMTEK